MNVQQAIPMPAFPTASDTRALLAQVIWDVAARGVPSDRKALLRLEGFSGAILSALPDQRPGTFTLLLDPDIPGLDVDEAHLLRNAPVRLRNARESPEPVLVAVSDEDAMGARASLGEVTVIDRASVLHATKAWLDRLEAVEGASYTTERERWMKALLSGLDASGSATDPERFAAFVHRVAVQGGLPLHQRVDAAAPALRLPRGSVRGLPAEGDARMTRSRAAAAFREADREASTAPLLRRADGQPLDGAAIEAAIAEAQTETVLEDMRSASFEALRQLLNDRQNLEPASWRESQQVFCEGFDWAHAGVLLGRARRRAPQLPEALAELVELEGGRDRRDRLMPLLERLQENDTAAASEILEAEGDWLATASPKLERKLIAKAVATSMRGVSLPALIVQGVRLLRERADGGIGSETHFRLTRRSCDRLSSWSELAPDLLDLFRFEMRTLKPALDGIVAIELGRWCDESARATRMQTGRKANEILLELELRDAEGTVVEAVRLEWAPSSDGVARCLPADLRALTHSGLGGDGPLRVWPVSLTATASGGTQAVHLDDRSSFATSASEALTAVASREGEEFFSRLSNGTTTEIAAAASAFRDAFGRAIRMLRDAPEIGLAGPEVPLQAAAFEALCRAVAAEAGDAVMRSGPIALVASFAVAPLGKDAAVVAAWHPLRLLERHSRIGMVRAHLEALTSTRDDGAERETYAVAAVLRDAHLPEVVARDGRILVQVETEGDYGLMRAGTPPTDVETAAATGLRAIERFLDLYPHEEADLSVAIDATSSAAAAEIAPRLRDGMRALAADRPSLHARLVLLEAHEDVRMSFARQNGLVIGEEAAGAAPGQIETVIPPRRPSDGSVDVALLAGTLSDGSQMVWDSVPCEGDLPAAPRLEDHFGRPVESDIEARTLRVDFAPRRPARALAAFLDLCRVTGPDAYAPRPGHRAQPARRLRWDEDGALLEKLRAAHAMANWVVSIDTLPARATLEDLDARIVQEMAATGRMVATISSGDFGTALTRRVRARLDRIAPDGGRQADNVLRTVARVAGRKLLGGGRSERKALEMIGLAAATRLAETDGAATWLSLDEMAGALGLRGEIADILGLRAQDDGLHLLVVEAKCVEAVQRSEQAAKSRKQAEGTVMRLLDRLGPNAPIGARRELGRRIAAAVATRSDLAAAIPDWAEMRTALEGGTVPVRISGLSIVSLHDGEDAPSSIDIAESRGRQHVLDRTTVARLLNGDVMDIDVLPPNISESVPGGTTESAVNTPPEPDVPSEAMSSPVPAKEQEDAKTENASEPPTASKRQEGNVSGLLSRIASLLGKGSEAGQAPAAADFDALAEDLERAVTKVTEAPQPQEAPQTPEENTADTSTDQSTTDAPAGAAKTEAASGLSSGVGVLLACKAAGRDASNAEMRAQQDAQRMAIELRAALTRYGLTAELRDEPLIITPNGVLVCFRGDDSMTPQALEKLFGKLRVSRGIDVTYVQPGLGWIGLFVAAEERRPVDLPATWTIADWPEAAPDSNVSLLLGLREDDGRPLWLNLDTPHGGQGQHAPHTLIAGETGSGKGVLLQNLILQLAATNAPSMLRLRMVDPKQGVDFPWIERLPHLDGPIVTDAEEAAAALTELCEEMERRYVRIRAAGVANIRAFNARVSPQDRMPRIVFVHDEMAAWMQGLEDYRRDVGAALVALASKARAAGIHIILVTQRADKDAIPPSVRDNLGNRLCLKVNSKAGSELALQYPGAEKLLGQGHLAANLQGDRPKGREFFVAQVPWADPDLIEAMVEALESGN